MIRIASFIVIALVLSGCLTTAIGQSKLPPDVPTEKRPIDPSEWPSPPKEIKRPPLPEPGPQTIIELSGPTTAGETFDNYIPGKSITFPENVFSTGFAIEQFCEVECEIKTPAFMIATMGENKREGVIDRDGVIHKRDDRESIPEFDGIIIKSLVGDK